VEHGSVIPAPILKFLGAFFWDWFRKNQNKTIYTVKVWIVKKAIKVADLRVLFVILFGEETIL
jgi:hypothetical protein